MDIIYYSHKIKPYAQSLRRKATPQENKLWYRFLRMYPVQFRRQKQFGCYIADFYCAKARLVIELDGSQHYTEDGIKHDLARTDAFKCYHIEVIRFTNPDIDNCFEAVCHAIDQKVKEKMYFEISQDEI